jgi:ribA/ribD-fused uncharacterized protein
MRIISNFKGRYRPLSNFYMTWFKYRREVYPSSEHAFQASKTLNKIHKDLIRTCQFPATAKKLGRTVELRPDWEEIKLKVMYKILLAKFKQDEKCREALLSTGNAKLIEGNHWHDNIWGECNCIRCSGKKKHNHLGKILMKVREELNEKDHPKKKIKKYHPNKRKEKTSLAPSQEELEDVPKLLTELTF